MAVVHRQRRDPIAGLAAQPFKRLGELPRIGSDPGPIGPAFASVGPARHDFAMRMFARGMIEQARHAQLEILHRSQHILPSRPSAARGQPASASLASEVLNTSAAIPCIARSEEHTSELQSLMRISYAVFCLKKQK